MTERLADIGARIDGIRQLGAVVNAMRGISAARIQQAGSQLAAVDTYAAAIVAAISRALALIPVTGREHGPIGQRRSSRPALLLFCAEQGFAGAFSDRVLNAAAVDLSGAELFLVGTRGEAAIAQRGVTPQWACAMPSHSPGIPKLADKIVQALYARIATGKISRADVVFGQWLPGHGVEVIRRQLFPFDLTVFPQLPILNAPLLHLAPSVLLNALIADYMYAQVCEVALHAFAAENEARLEAMTSARTQVERQLSSLMGTQRVIRQEEITSEIIELAAGETASRSGEHRPQ